MTIIERLAKLPETATYAEIRSALEVPVGTGISLPAADRSLPDGCQKWSRRALIEWARSGGKESQQETTYR